MNTTAIISFIDKNIDCKGHGDFLKRSIIDNSSSSFVKGYITANRHAVKRKKIASKRGLNVVNGVIEKLSDLTHK
jgi:hypothetical protein